MRKLLFLAAGMSVGMAASAATAQEISCGSTYTVEAGDYLSKIAQRAYGSLGSYDLLYSRNAETIGSDPGRIFPGMVLEIPCLGGEATLERTESAEPTEASQLGGVEGAPGREYRFILYHDWAPFFDRNEQDGGLLTHIVRRSMELATTQPDFKIDFTSDFELIMTPLLTDHLYDMGAGWTKPDCDSFESLGEESQFRCTDLAWSEPIYEEVIAYFTLDTDGSYDSYADISGLRICRPAGFTTAAMDAAGVKEPFVTLVRPQEPGECIEALLNDEADIAVIATDVAEGTAKELGIEDRISLHDSLSHVSTLHVVAAKDHPDAIEMIAILDDGLAQLKNSGEWFQIVREKMTAHRARQ